MANPIQPNASVTPSSSIRKGNVAVGINPAEYSQIGNFWSGIDCPAGGYVTYINKPTNGPSIYVSPSDQDYINLVSGDFKAPGITGISSALSYVAGLSDRITVNKDYWNAVTGGLVLMMDPGYTPSYPRGGTSYYDLSGDSKNGTLTNGVGFSSIGALSFDGVDDFVDVQQSVSMGNPTTVCVLFNRTFATGAAQVFFGPTSNGSDNWISISGNVLTLFATEIADVNNFSISGTTSISINRWYYATGIINGTTATLYLNGSQESTITKPFTIGSWTGTVRIGTRGSGQFPFAGRIGLVQAYNRVLTQSEILQNYYQASIVTNGLVFAVDAGNLVSFETGTTGAYSLSGNIPGSLLNGVTYLQEDGGVWKLDGTDDNIQFPSTSALQLTNNLTISLWIYSQAPKTGLGIVTKGPLRDDYDYMVYITNNSTQVVFYKKNSSGTVSSTGFTTTLLDKWSNICVTKDGTSVIWYENAALKSSTNLPDSGIRTSSQPLNIGSGWSATFDGKLPGVQIYNRALTASEVLQNFNAQKSRYGL